MSNRFIDGDNPGPNDFAEKRQIRNSANSAIWINDEENKQKIENYKKKSNRPFNTTDMINTFGPYSNKPSTVSTLGGNVLKKRKSAKKSKKSILNKKSLKKGSKKSKKSILKKKSLKQSKKKSLKLKNFKTK